MDAAVILPQPDEAAKNNAVSAFYRFLALSFGHPEESTLKWFQSRDAADELLDAVFLIHRNEPDTFAEFRKLGDAMVAEAGRLSMEDLEAVYIAMFSFGAPDVLCPPYGSLYTSADDTRRLEEMIAAKSFYESCGVNITEEYTDLPDHVSVEFEMLNVLAGHAAEAAATDDDKRAEWARDRSLEFLDRFALPLLDGMSGAASMVSPRNLYCQLIDLAALFAQCHRNSLTPSQDSGRQALKGGE